MPDPKRDESRDLLVDAYGTVRWVSSGREFGDIIRSITGKASRLVPARYVPYSDLEAAQRRIAELELALEYTGRERDGNFAESWNLRRELDCANYRIADLESLLQPK